MFFSAAEVKKDLEADICIIGSGPAGLAVALEFLDSGKKVCILESDSAVLNDLEASGLPISNDSRCRGFGGTSRVWLGIWKQFDPEDLESWPVKLAGLQPFYQRAARRFSAPSNSETKKTFFDSQTIVPTELARIGKADLNLGEKYRDEFEKSKNVTVCLGANVTRLIKEAGRISKAEARTLSANTFNICAKHFVLAAGGIENPRLLLLSNLGGENAGRFYMDHPKGVAGVITNPSRKLREFYFKAGDKWLGLALSPQIRRQKQLLNSHIILEPIKTRFLRRITSVRIRNHMEQMPSADNRVTLSDKKDALGLPKARISWQMSEADKRTMIEFHKVFQGELSRLGLGMLESPLLTPGANFSITKDASHHMGTTRMGTDPTASVVDENCKLHGIDNLYLAGSSVFCTSGYANPMAAIAVLAIRLADHLKTRI